MLCRVVWKSLSTSFLHEKGYDFQGCSLACSIFHSLSSSSGGEEKERLQRLERLSKRLMVYTSWRYFLVKARKSSRGRSTVKVGDTVKKILLDFPLLDSRERWKTTLHTYYSRSLLRVLSILFRSKLFHCSLREGQEKGIPNCSWIVEHFLQSDKFLCLFPTCFLPRIRGFVSKFERFCRNFPELRE